MRIRRRAFLFGSLAALPGCSSALFGLPGEPAPPFDHDGPSKMRVAAFEVEPVDFMLHTGLIVHTPEDRVLYDPGGFWRDRRAIRRGDVVRGMNPRLEESYLTRASLALSSRIWTLHLFEAEVPDDVARRAVEIAEERDPYMFGGCSYGVSSLLAELPGFEDIRVTFAPSGLVAQLQARNDFRYSTRELGAMQQEA